LIDDSATRHRSPLHSAAVLESLFPSSLEIAEYLEGGSTSLIAKETEQSAVATIVNISVSHP